MESELSNFVFFQLINDFLLDELDIFQWQLLQRTSLWVGSVALILLTLWILFQGYRLAAGRSGEPMMALVGDALRAVLIIGLATSMATGGSQLYWRLTDGLAETLNRVITGQDESPFKSIDRNMAVMQGSLTLIDALNTGGDAEVENAKTQAQWFTGIGTAGPALVAGSALLLNKIAVALFLGFGPLFILCLLFKKTEPMFGRWLFYGLGTFFSLSVLSVMAGLAMKMIGAISMAFVARQLAVQSGVLTVTDGEGVSSLAMQQGGIGLLLSVLLMMTPVMAARFFNGLLGQLAAFNAFGRVGAGNARQRPPHAAPPPHHGGDDGPSPDHLPPLHTRGAESAQHLDVIKKAPPDEGDFLARYPHATAGLNGGGPGDPLPAALRGTEPVFSVNAKGYIEGAGLIHNPVSALERGELNGPHAIVLHRTVSSTASSTIAAFERGVGTHFVIDKDGTIYQTASLGKKTAHVGPIRSRCFEENTCSPTEAARIRRYSPKQGHDHEKTKHYPERYPMNEDSVGIEVVAMYHQETEQWDAPTPAQKEAISRLVSLLQSNYSMTDADVYEHDKISRKTAGEGAGLYDGNDRVPARFPPPFF